MIKGLRCLLIVAGFFQSATSLAEREIRFWVGDRNNHAELAADDEAAFHRHLEFIRNALGPATLVAGQGALDYYAIYIPPREPPAGAVARTMPFSEAALPSYISTEAYAGARAKHPEYGPLHGKENGFNFEASYSATPKPLDDLEIAEGVRVSTKNDRVAYDLRTNRSDNPNWRAGTTLVWLVMRRTGVSNSDYRKQLARQFKVVAHGGYLEDRGVLGHYARVDESFVLHFINVVSDDHVEGVIQALQDLHEATANSIAIHVNTAVAESREPFSKGWDAAITPAKAVNVQF